LRLELATRSWLCGSVQLIFVFIGSCVQAGLQRLKRSSLPLSQLAQPGEKNWKNTLRVPALLLGLLLVGGQSHIETGTVYRRVDVQRLRLGRAGQRSREN